MPASLTCLLSYGLTCGPIEIPTIEPPDPSTVIEPVSSEPAEAPQGAASQVLARVQAFYDKTSDFTAHFKQTYVHAVYGTKKVREGQLRVKKPGKMVWDYQNEQEPDYWVDGKRVWVVERPQKQVISTTLGNSDFTGIEKFLFGGNQLRSDFLVKIASGTALKQYELPGHTSIQLRPKQKNPHYEQLLLVVNDASGRVDAFVVLNQDKSTSHFVLTNIKRNTGISASDMQFQPPAGFAVIDQ
jgi:outer membrane lipoprotein carrier protein